MSDVEWVVKSKKFRNKKTGEIVTQVPLLDINDYDEVKEHDGKYIAVREPDTKKKRKMRDVS